MTSAAATKPPPPSPTTPARPPCKPPIEGLASVTAGDVAVTGGPGPSTPWFVTWKGNYAATEVAEFTIDGSSLTGNGGVTVATTTQGGGLSDEVQLLTIRNPAVSPGGTYTLTFGGQTTGNIAYNATAATVQTALEALSSIGSGNVLVYGGDQANSPEAGIENFIGLWIVFTGALAATNVGEITADSGALNGLISRSTMTQGGLSTRDEIQLINLGNPNRRHVQLIVRRPKPPPTSHTKARPGASFVQAGLQALSTIGSGNVNVWEISGAGATSGGNWFAVKFLNTLGDTDVGAITVGEGSLTGQTGSATVTTIHSGGGSSDEVQTVTIHGTGGTFTLSDGNRHHQRHRLQRRRRHGQKPHRNRLCRHHHRHRHRHRRRRRPLCRHLHQAPATRTWTK